MLLDRFVGLWMFRPLVAIRSRKNTARLLPKPERDRHRIDVGLVPPRAFVTLAVKLAMMDAAQRNRELIRDPATHCSRLREPKMVGLAWPTATYSARLPCYEAKMMFVTTATRLHQGEAVDTFDGHS